MDIVKNVFKLQDYSRSFPAIKELLDGKEHFISLTPKQYHKKVMLFTLPQFFISLYGSMYCTKTVRSAKYLYHTHHLALVFLTSVLYWGNYDNEKANILRRVDMTAVMFGTLSLFWRSAKYSKELTKASGFMLFLFTFLYMTSWYLNKRFPYKSIWFHSLAHTFTHIYNLHYFLTIYRIKLRRKASISLE